MISSNADSHHLEDDPAIDAPSAQAGVALPETFRPAWEAQDKTAFRYQAAHELQASNHTILLVAPEPAATAVAHALRRDLNTPVQIAVGGRSGLVAMRREEFTVIVLEENLAAAEPEATEALYTLATTVPVLEINFGLCGVERIVRQVRSALERRAADEAKARSAVSNSLVNELNASLAGLLLESQLAMRQASPEVLPALQHLIHLASELRAQLRS